VAALGGGRIQVLALTRARRLAQTVAELSG
jgi:hypothetical protein